MLILCSRSHPALSQRGPEGLTRGKVIRSIRPAKSYQIYSACLDGHRPTSVRFCTVQYLWYRPTFITPCSSSYPYFRGPHLICLFGLAKTNPQYLLRGVCEWLRSPVCPAHSLSRLLSQETERALLKHTDQGRPTVYCVVRGRWTVLSAKVARRVPRKFSAGHELKSATHASGRAEASSQNKYGVPEPLRGDGEETMPLNGRRGRPAENMGSLRSTVNPVLSRERVLPGRAERGSTPYPCPIRDASGRTLAVFDDCKRFARFWERQLGIRTRKAG